MWTPCVHFSTFRQCFVSPPWLSTVTPPRGIRFTMPLMTSERSGPAHHCQPLAWLSSAPFRLLAISLGVLHLGLLQGVDHAVGAMLILMHLGLFLIWQPLVRGAYRLSAKAILIMLVAIVSFMALLSWGLMAAWLMVLAGIVGGEAFVATTPRARLPYQLVVAYLMGALFIVVLPRVVPAPVDESGLFGWLPVTLLPALILAAALFPGEEIKARSRGIDFISAMLLILVLAVTTLAAMVFMWLEQLPYLVAILYALFAMAGLLLLLTWAWHPGLGGPQLGTQFARRLLSAGMSLEEWLHRVAGLSVSTQTPEAFLALASEEMAKMPGVRGGRWEIAEGRGRFGVVEGVTRAFRQEGVSMTLYLTREPSPAMSWHLNLMVRVLAEFCREKRHARELQTLSYVRAVHETGARLTHDVKNLLQSLNTLCFTATRPEATPETLQALVGRQLPVITARLAQTLEKLRRPETEADEWVAFELWWRLLRERHAGSPVIFLGDVSGSGQRVPAGLFNAAADNLIQNALDKRLLDPAVSVRVSVAANGDGPILSVEDSGAPVSAAMDEHLFRQPVESENGLGMGLYQVARQAEDAGFALRLDGNAPGCVRFVLTQAGVD